METIQYAAQEGERWDTISQKAYGNPMEAPRLIAANPNIPVTTRLPAGTVVELPVLQEYVVKTKKEQLPPWKR